MMSPVCTGPEEEGSSTNDAVEPQPPLTASLAGAPSTHDGQTAFTFELRFSEEVKLSYVTLRGHAFTVTDGTVTKAQRLTQGSNIGWTITVTPDSAADVTRGPARHHGLRRRGSRLHRGRKEALQPAGVHRLRAGGLERG